MRHLQPFLFHFHVQKTILFERAREHKRNKQSYAKSTTGMLLSVELHPLNFVRVSRSVAVLLATTGVLGLGPAHDAHVAAGRPGPSATEAPSS